MTRALIAFALVACTHPTPAASQQVAPAPVVATKANILEAVIAYRALFMNDDSRFDRRTVSRELGGASADELLEPFYAGRVEGSTSPRAGNGPVAVGIRSISTADSSATVELLVHHGEYVHHETFNLRSRGPRFHVMEVRLWGNLYIMPAP